MNAKKKIVSVALAASLAATAIVGGTLAYFTDTDNADNVFTVGNVDIVLTEPNWDNGGKEDAVNMYPGEVVSKDPTVTNVGNNPCLLRVKIEWPENVDLDYLTDGVEYKLGENWTARDGVYYYQSILEPTQTTDALFDEIRLDPATTNAQTGEYDIKVTAEAVQSEGFTGTLTPESMADWFAACMGE